MLGIDLEELNAGLGAVVVAVVVLAPRLCRSLLTGLVVVSAAVRLVVSSLGFLLRRPGGNNAFSGSYSSWLAVFDDDIDTRFSDCPFVATSSVYLFELDLDADADDDDDDDDLL